MTLNIYQKINAVQKKVEYVRKDTTVKLGYDRGYAAVSHDELVSILRKHMVEIGILTYPEQISGTLHEQGNKYDAKTGETHVESSRMYTGMYRIHFVNIDDPTDRVDPAPVVEAAGQDSSDKGPGKAVTYATKSAFLKVFNLETGENEESRTEQRRAKIDITNEQIDELDKLIAQADPKCRPTLLTAYNIQNLGDLPQAKFGECQARIAKRIKAFQKK